MKIRLRSIVLCSVFTYRPENVIQTGTTFRTFTLLAGILEIVPLGQENWGGNDIGLNFWAIDSSEFIFLSAGEKLESVQSSKLFLPPSFSLLITFFFCFHPYIRTLHIPYSRIFFIHDPWEGVEDTIIYFPWQWGLMYRLVRLEFH